MSASGSTYWTMIEAAAGGDAECRERFADVYMPIVKAYLRKRWQGTRRIESVDDATQEIFLECFKENGPLERADRGRAGGFRAFLFGISRNVARRHESGRTGHQVQVQDNGILDAVPTHDPTASIQFDRVWAQAMMVLAAKSQKARAQMIGKAALRRVELLRLRFQENLPIREIAEQWDVAPEKLHREYARCPTLCRGSPDRWPASAPRNRAGL